MKSLVVHFSKFGNTQKIAEAIAEILRSAGDVPLISLNQLNISDFNETDLLVMGVPTHRMKLPDEVKMKLALFPRRIMHHIPFAAFDTSYKMSPWLARFTAARKLSGRLRRLGGKQLIPVESFHVIEKEGPLYDGEIEHARDWANVIFTHIR